MKRDAQIILFCMKCQDCMVSYRTRMTRILAEISLTECFFIAHKIHKRHKSAHAVLVLTSGVFALGTAASEGEATRHSCPFVRFVV